MATATADNEDNFNFERGILANVNKFSSVFNRIFLKFDRPFEASETRGILINFGDNVSLQKFVEDHIESVDKEDVENVDSTDDDVNGVPIHEDVFITRVDPVDPELAVELHKKVVQIKKEINWSEDEEEEIPAEDTYVIADTSQEEITASSDDNDPDCDTEIDILTSSPNSSLMHSPLQATSKKIVRQSRIRLPELKINKTTTFDPTVSNYAISEPVPPELQTVIPCHTSPSFYEQRISCSPLQYSSCSSPQQLRSTTCTNTCAACAVPNSSGNLFQYRPSSIFSFTPECPYMFSTCSACYEQYNRYGAKVGCCEYCPECAAICHSPKRREKRLSAEFSPPIKRHCT